VENLFLLKFNSVSFSPGSPDTVKPLGETALRFESAGLRGDLTVEQAARHGNEHESGIGGDFRVAGSFSAGGTLRV
jgi:hypothetical protein